LIAVDSVLVYRFSPSPLERDWHHIWPGAITSIALMLLISSGFRTYLAYFDRYTLLYGSIGAVIILTLWLYLAGVAILVGGHVNAELMAAGVTVKPSERRRNSSARVIDYGAARKKRR
jgi:membrane protein